MDLQALQAVWEQLARNDPLWAVVSQADRRGGKWDVAEFFATGDALAGNVMRHLEAFNLPARREACLDFGCGPGRATQAFCAHFESSHGVDIAPGMVELAQHHNRFGDRCRYHVNVRGDLAMFPDDTFDLVHSCIVLQHIEPQYAKGYIREFLRVARPGGAVVFQLPSHRRPAAPAAALPDGAFAARIELAEPVAERLPAGGEVVLSVRVTNLGDAGWPAHTEGAGAYHVRLGNHWLTRRGKVITTDDGRSRLPVDIGPGGSAVMSLRVTAPSKPGRYLLELDLVQELVTWFAERGSETLRLPVVVRGPKRPVPDVRVGPAEPEGAPPAGPGVSFDMHGVPREEVMELVRAAGGTVLATHEDPYAGTDWVSYLYFVTPGAVPQADR